MDAPSYVLITPARNEETYIEQTIRSVISQSRLPTKWVIVSDGSVDRTDDTVRRYEADYGFIRLLRREGAADRDFRSKVYAFNAGVQCLGDIGYDFIGNLDGDVSFEPTYYERVLSYFREFPQLGVAGGLLHERHGARWRALSYSVSSSVGGPIQLFRRQCYEDIGGYRPLKRGGIDMIAEVMARMHGWDVRTLSDVKVFHHRRTGTEKASVLAASFRRGMMEYVNGYHPLFQAARFISRIMEKPVLLASSARTCGYASALLRRLPYEVPQDVRQYLRHEQIRRLLTVSSLKER